MRTIAQLILAAGICLLALIGYGAAYSAVSAKSAAVSALQAEIDAHAATVNRLSTARATLAELSTEESALEDYFVPQSSIVPFIDSLQAGARSLGTTIQVRSVSTGGTPTRPILSLSLTIAGSFDGVMRTIGAVEYGPYAVSVSKLSVAVADKGLWESTMDIVIGSRAEIATSTTP